LLKTERPLVKLTNAIDWNYFEQEFSPLVAEAGRPALPVRLMVGLHYLKAMSDASDESVVEKWTEDPYWQYFCMLLVSGKYFVRKNSGEEHFQHELPCHPTSKREVASTSGCRGSRETA
jgi:IS5 family transposase